MFKTQFINYRGRLFPKMQPEKTKILTLDELYIQLKIFMFAFTLNEAPMVLMLREFSHETFHLLFSCKLAIFVHIDRTFGRIVLENILPELSIHL